MGALAGQPSLAPANPPRSHSDRVSARFLAGPSGNLRPGVKMHVRPLAPRPTGCPASATPLSIISMEASLSNECVFPFS